MKQFLFGVILSLGIFSLILAQTGEFADTKEEIIESVSNEETGNLLGSMGQKEVNEEETVSICSNKTKFKNDIEENAEFWSKGDYRLSSYKPSFEGWSVEISGMEICSKGDQEGQNKDYHYCKPAYSENIVLKYENVSESGVINDKSKLKVSRYVVAGNGSIQSISCNFVD